jgi:hypothetical protein
LTFYCVLGLEELLDETTKVGAAGPYSKVSVDRDVMMERLELGCFLCFLSRAFGAAKGDL